MNAWIKWAWFERLVMRETSELAIRSTRGLGYVAVLIGLVLPMADADARCRRRRCKSNCYRQCNASPQKWPVVEPADKAPPELEDAAKAEPRKFARPFDHIALKKAVYMAERGIGGHHLMHLNGQIRGSWFEGVGWSGAGTHATRVPTCTPGYRKTLVGDAVCRRNGRIYRVRLWR